MCICTPGVLPLKVTLCALGLCAGCLFASANNQKLCGRLELLWCCWSLITMTGASTSRIFLSSTSTQTHVFLYWRAVGMLRESLKSGEFLDQLELNPPTDARRPCGKLRRSALLSVFGSRTSLRTPLFPFASLAAAAMILSVCRIKTGRHPGARIVFRQIPPRRVPVPLALWPLFLPRRPIPSWPHGATWRFRLCLQAARSMLEPALAGKSPDLLAH